MPTFPLDDGDYGRNWEPVIAGELLPENVLARVSGFSRKAKVDKKPYVDLSGATLTLSGYELATWKLSIEAWDQGGQDWLFRLVPKLQPKPEKGGVQPFEIEHPVLALYGIRSCVVESVDGPEWANQRWTLTCSCVQYARPPKPGAKKETATPITSFGGNNALVSEPVSQTPKPPSAGAKSALTGK